MEAGAEHSQRHVEFGGEDEQEEGFAEFHHLVEQAEADLDGDDGGADGRQQFERKRGEEGDAQDAEGGVEVAGG